MTDTDMNKITIQKYFKLSDYASSDMNSLKAIIDLFSDDAKIKSGINETATNKKEVADFFRLFFGRNKQLKHLFEIRDVDNNYQTEWVVAGLKSDGSLFSLHGFDYYKFDNDGKIIDLKVIIS
ncbi:nuclear transport factor 2 family protein [Companilactobacillus huachuanensis]|uniref:Nuclear transport factor 2 family protein n=1 Tax=Companilactobacillus huachuanensis TaxID=2559914 RepID=A0ABW1RN08_9LACO|nr:nuclear transport factor 2 family protein [Companilactobacillus huachuanensis]